MQDNNIIKRIKILILITGILLLACSPYLIIPTTIDTEIGTHLGGLVITGNYEEFCFILTETIITPHLEWWNPFATCSESNMDAAFDEDLDELAPGGVIDLADDYDDGDGMDEFFQMLRNDFNLDTNIVASNPPNPVYGGLDLPVSPFTYTGQTATDSYYQYSFDGPTTDYTWGAYCLAFETNAEDRPVISDIRIGCCYDGFTECSEEACDRCVGAPLPPTIPCFSGSQEAEDGVLSGNFVIGNDTDASGDHYIHVPNGSGDAGSPGGTQASYCFTTSTDGDYRVRAWVYAANGDDNSFFVTLDGSPGGGYLWDIPQATNYPSDYVSDRGGADPVEVYLSAGDHVINIYLREDGARLDKIELVPAEF